MNNLIMINIDDEHNILKMNKRILNKSDLDLTCVRSGKDLVNLLNQIYQDSLIIDENKIVENSHDLSKIKIIIFVDHMLDDEYGYEVISNCLNLYENWKLNITYVLLSSTEDEETIEK